jgi:hypothetical protein
VAKSYEIFSIFAVLLFLLGAADAQTATDTQNNPAGWENTTMQTGQGTTMTLYPQTLNDSRDYRYCELVFNYGDIGSDIYSTSPLAECSEEWWDGLDLEALAEEFGAESVVKNGPQNWTMDEVAVLASEPVPVAGVDMVFGAHLPPGTLETPQYEVFSPAKNQYLVWEAGKPVYELVDPEGNVYVLQGNKVPTESLATLGDDFEELPDGWEYRVVVLNEDLVMDLTTARQFLPPRTVRRSISGFRNREHLVVLRSTKGG